MKTIFIQYILTMFSLPPVLPRSFPPPYHSGSFSLSLKQAKANQPNLTQTQTVKPQIHNFPPKQNGGNKNKQAKVK